MVASEDTANTKHKSSNDSNFVNLDSKNANLASNVYQKESKLHTKNDFNTSNIVNNFGKSDNENNNINAQCMDTLALLGGNVNVIDKDVGTKDKNIKINENAKSHIDCVPQIDSKYELRILSGPHKGAAICLQQNQNLIIGQSDDCDVILIDKNLQGKHAIFTVDDNKIICTPSQNSITFVDGNKIECKTEIREFSPIICGDTLMAIGNKESKWPQIDPVKIECNSENIDTKSINQKIDNNKSKKILKKISITALIAAFLIILSMISMIHLFKEDVHETKNAEKILSIDKLKKLVNASLQKYNVDPNYSKMLTSGNNIILSVYVKTIEIEVNLKNDLDQLPKYAFQSFRIYSQERIIKQAQEALIAHHDLFATPGARLDSILLKGYLYAIDTLQSIQNNLINSVPGLRYIETALLSPEEVSELASNLLTKYNLMGLLNVQAISTGIVINGNIQSLDENNWKQAQKALKKTFDKICRVMASVTIVEPEIIKKKVFPETITTVFVPKNGKPWIDLKNGDRYIEGTLLPSNYRIEAITNNEIKLKKNNEEIIFSISQL